jgi:sigma-B regulation protein RsbU (phosphoserine phosphatase)
LRILLVTARPESALPALGRVAPAWAEVRVVPPARWSEDADPDIVLVDVPADDAEALERALALAARLRDGPVAMAVLSETLPTRRRVALYRAGVLACLAFDDDREEVAARLASLLAAKRTAVAVVRRLREHTRQMDDQMRLAQRLQRDFLPRRLPDVVGGHFAARLEPAAWVAGDFYDIFRLDERHVGFYVADAVGHGVPAALLTVFVKKSLQTKRIDGKQYELIPPAEALDLLNKDLASAELQEAPFITMVYGIYNEQTRQLVYARAGHPQPILLTAAGTLERLPGNGPLLGIFLEAKFETCEQRLEPGDRLILYTDGADRLDSGRGTNPEKLLEIIRDGTLLPTEALLDAVLDAVRAATGGDPLADDVTLVALERDAAGA